MNKITRHARAHRGSVRQPPASGQRPKLVTRQNVTTAVKELIDYYHGFGALFRRHEQSDWSWFYLCGQLSNLERKTIEPMVLGLLGAIPNAIRDLQRFMGESKWDTAPFIVHLQTLVAAWLGERDGVAIVDGSGFPKQGKHSIGVAHQYCGHLGKIANCQEGVFLAYASGRGCAFLDERLYLPQEWFAADHRKLRKAGRLPEGIQFQTEGQLALDMLQKLKEQAVVPFAWVAYDESYGKNPGFSAAVAALGKWYMAEVPRDTRIWLRTPQVEEPGPSRMGPPRLHRRVRRSAPLPEEVWVLARNLPRSAWHRHLIHEGSQGPLVAEFAVLRTTPIHDRLPGIRQWLICRRSLGPQPEEKFYLSNAPAHCPAEELIRISGLRWPVETALEENKGETGMDHYETRTWWGWHHQMLQSFMAHLFLVRLCLVFQKKILRSPSPKLGNLWPRPSRKKPDPLKMPWPRSTTINGEIMLPTVPIGIILKKHFTYAPKKRLVAKRRSNNQNVVVM